MPILPDSAQSIKLPRMLRVRQLFPDERISDIPSAIRQEIGREEIRSKIMPESKIAVLVGSRGIADIQKIVAETVGSIKAAGGVPFIVPAMGSHGGATAEGQAGILAGYGITEDRIGAPVIASMETVEIGCTPDGVPVHIDKIASQADMIVPVARIKAHTGFSGPIESGLCKMLAIGMGKHKGCSRLHREGYERFPKLIPDVAACIIGKFNVGFGVAIIENAHDHVHTIRAVSGSRFIDEEPGLLALSKSLMPKLHFKDIDVLVVEQIGKNISGTGLDPNIIGRTDGGSLLAFQGPEIKRIVVLGLSEETQCNANGIGLADFTTDAVFRSIDFK